MDRDRSSLSVTRSTNSHSSSEPPSHHRLLAIDAKLETAQSAAMGDIPVHGAYPWDDGTFIRFPSRRSVVHGTKGIVSTSSPLATEAGLQVLREGGNAAVSLSITY